MKMNSSVLPVLVVIVANVIMPKEGPILLACIVAAMIIVPIVVYLLQKKKSEPIEIKSEEPDCSQAESNDCVEKNETRFVSEITETENPQPEITSENYIFVETAETETDESETEELEQEVCATNIAESETAETDIVLNQAEDNEQTDDDNELLLEEKSKARRIEVERARQAYLVAKKSGLVAVPVLSFRLSREDVLDHADSMALDKANFPVDTATKLRSKAGLPDSLYCGEWCFGLIYEKKNIIKLVLRLDDIEALELTQIHPGICAAKFPGGENWFTVIVDCSYTSKKEVYDIIDLAYQFVLRKYYELKDEGYVTNIEQAKQDTVETEIDVLQNEKTADPVLDSAIEEYEVAVSDFNTKHKLDFSISRADILNHARKAHKENVTIIERERWYLPASLRVYGKTYAMIYEKNEKVRMTLRLDDDYAESLVSRHSELCRARFPKGHNWYAVAIDGSFYSKKEIYIILKQSQKFIEESYLALKQSQELIEESNSNVTNLI